MTEGTLDRNFRVALVSVDADGVPEWVFEKIRAAGIEIAIETCDNKEDLERVASYADVVWLFGGGLLFSEQNRQNFDAIPQCGAIIRSGSGTDNVAIGEATTRGIMVCNTPAATAEEVSDHAIGLYFALVRQIGSQNRLMREGVWDLSRGHPYQRVSGRTLGIIGFGHIARCLVRKMAGFNQIVHVYDPAVAATVIEEAGCHASPLDTVLAKSDWVSIHCPLLPATQHLIGEAELRKMKDSAFVINTARGQIIDEAALVKALQEGWIAGAGFDVFEEEPTPPDNPLLSMDNVVSTPHIAGYSDQTHHNFWSLSVETVVDLASGRLPQSCVNGEVTPKWPLK